MHDTKRTDEVKITRGTLDLIKEAIEETGSTNRYEICRKMAENVENRYGGLSLEYQLKRMKIETTGDILRAIDAYFFKYFREPVKQTS